MYLKKGIPFESEIIFSNKHIDWGYPRPSAAERKLTIFMFINIGKK